MQMLKDRFSFHHSLDSRIAKTLVPVRLDRSGWFVPLASALRGTSSSTLGRSTVTGTMGRLGLSLSLGLGLGLGLDLRLGLRLGLVTTISAVSAIATISAISAVSTIAAVATVARSVSMAISIDGLGCSDSDRHSWRARSHSWGRCDSSDIGSWDNRGSQPGRIVDSAAALTGNRCAARNPLGDGSSHRGCLSGKRSNRLGWWRRNHSVDASGVVVVRRRCWVAATLAGCHSDDAGSVGGDNLSRRCVGLCIGDRTHGCRCVSGQCLSALSRVVTVRRRGDGC
jgi:hypothetical protein